MGITSSKRKSSVNEHVNKPKFNDNEKESNLERKYVFLGADGCGKSTLFKQVNLLYGSRDIFSSNRQAYARSIVSNIFRGFEFIDNHNSSLPENVKNLIETLKNRDYDVDSISSDDAKIINHVWSIDDVKHLYFTIPDGQHNLSNWPVFLDKLKDYPEWGGDGWAPNNEECLLARIRTTGIVQAQIKKDNISGVILDIGGSRNDRKNGSIALITPQLLFMLYHWLTMTYF